MRIRQRTRAGLVGGAGDSVIVIGKLAVTTVTPVVEVVIATIAGLAAASPPARRAAPVNILDTAANE